MDHFLPRLEALRSSLTTMKTDSYKVDEGYSEDTRSQDGSESSTRLDGGVGHDAGAGGIHLNGSAAVILEDLVRGLGEAERSGRVARVPPSNVQHC